MVKEMTSSRMAKQTSKMDAPVRGIVAHLLVRWEARAEDWTQLSSSCLLNQRNVR